MAQKSEEKIPEKTIPLGRIGDRPIWGLYLSICVRAVHQVAAAVFLTLYLFNGLESASIYLIPAVVTGVMLFLVESFRHRQMYKELTGLVTLVKLVLVGAVYHGFFEHNLLILLVFVIASLASHAPRHIRHRIFF